MRASILLALLPAVLGAPTRRSEPAPLHVPRDVDSLIKDTYIVKYKDITAFSAVDEGIKVLTGKPAHVFKGAFKGFAGKIDAEALEILRDDPSVSGCHSILYDNCHFRASGKSRWLTIYFAGRLH